MWWFMAKASVNTAKHDWEFWIINNNNLLPVLFFSNNILGCSQGDDALSREDCLRDDYIDRHLNVAFAKRGFCMMKISSTASIIHPIQSSHCYTGCVLSAAFSTSKIKNTAESKTIKFQEPSFPPGWKFASDTFLNKYGRRRLKMCYATVSSL
jgi:hypothetical protein